MYDGMLAINDMSNDYLLMGKKEKERTLPTREYTKLLLGRNKPIFLKLKVGSRVELDMCNFDNSGN